jgi:hypothetical protein
VPKPDALLVRLNAQYYLTGPAAQCRLPRDLPNVAAAPPILLSGSQVRLTGLGINKAQELESATTRVPARAIARYNTERTSPPSTRMVVPVM